MDGEQMLDFEAGTECPRQLKQRIYNSCHQGNPHVYVYIFKYQV